MHFYLISLHFTLQSFFCTSQFSKTRGSIPTDGETGCLPLCWRALDASCAKWHIMLYIFHPQVVKALTDAGWRVQPRSQNTHRHTWVGVWVQLEVVYCQTWRQADCIHIHHTHTDWNWQGSHTHTQLGWKKKKNLMVSKSIFQGQPAILKNL